ncbi:high affinity cationic amino acid transporter 1-like [Octopus sinensis]|uniref:High affinity cationic amino acid transporter 1-like n=1 Tax=Octopus sinensis TaxID=2607531 RepID=A0A7E6FP59_9MOLL|nr:high affinity cationic amino acid transporter 1-like [Octopus sinensis]XP_036369482.1 high affinity cationic amino acid transporter 1-like [Octopus sinensis]
MAILMRILMNLFRKKAMSNEGMEKTKLARVLTLLDLTLLGVGSTLGAGAYVLSGAVARDKAGPAIVLSFFVAAVVSVLAGLCYAEFGARVPKTGSAYVYSYITVGELIAFIIGWNLILEYAIGTASVARAWTANFNSLIDNAVIDFFNSTMPIRVDYLSEYPDFLAFGLVALLTILLTVGVKQSTLFNNVFTIINLLVLLYVIICGFFQMKLKNWQLTPDEVPPKYGNGGFMPYGVSGMLSGAATCFYGFVGFDCIATTGEEAKNPQKAIPISIILSLIIVFLFYFFVSMVLTMMSPYYLLDVNAPLPAVFSAVGWDTAKYVIAVGAICALTASMVGAIFPLPRVVYAMAEDKVIFSVFSNVSEKFKTPVLATLIAGLFSGLTALIFDLTELVNMMSIGTLLAYTFVAKCVVILRYKKTIFEEPLISDRGTYYNSTSVNTPNTDMQKVTPSFSFAMLFKSQQDVPNQTTEKIVLVTSSLLSLAAIALCVVLVFAEDYLSSGWAIYLIVQFLVLMTVCMVIIAMQPSNTADIPFKVPFVPVIPEISAALNIYLMLKLPVSTWIRFCVWMFVGFLVYFGYGYEHSTAKRRDMTDYVNITEDESD